MWFPARHHQFTATEHAVKGRQLWFLMHFSNRSEQRISSGPADMNIFPRLSFTLSSIYFDSNVCDRCRVFLSVVCFNGCFIIYFFTALKDVKISNTRCRWSTTSGFSKSEDQVLPISHGQPQWSSLSMSWYDRVSQPTSDQIRLIYLFLFFNEFGF